MIRVTERTSLVTGSAFSVALAVTLGVSHTKSSGHLVANGLFLLAAFLGQTFLLGFFPADTFFLLLFFPFLLSLLFLAFLFLILLFSVLKGYAFLDILSDEFLLGRFHLRLRYGRRGSGRFLRRFLPGILRLEHSGGGIYIPEINEYTPVFIRYLGFQYGKPKYQ